VDQKGPGRTPGSTDTETARAATPARRGSFRRAAALVVAVVLLLAAGLLLYGTVTDQAGTVVFSTDAPASGTYTGCTINDQVTTVSASTSVYATYMFRPTPGDAVISLSVTKNGKTLVDAAAIPTPYTRGIQCFSDTADLSKIAGWGPGVFHFSASDGSTVVAAGDLIVT
jgi:hypothetical protein